MLFEGRASNWALTKLEIENLGIEVPFQINGMRLIIMREGMTSLVVGFALSSFPLHHHEQ